jgi:hypothetical protein
MPFLLPPFASIRIEISFTRIIIHVCPVCFSSLVWNHNWLLRRFHKRWTAISSYTHGHSNNKKDCFQHNLRVTFFCAASQTKLRTVRKRKENPDRPQPTPAWDPVKAAGIMSPNAPQLIRSTPHNEYSLLNLYRK